MDYVAATETPVPVMDYDRWEVVPEILLMRGVKIPKSKQIPLLDSHSRWSSTSVIGSARDLHVVGSELRATAHFASTGPAKDIFPLVQEGHLSDVSVGYRVNESVFIPAGQRQTVEGKQYDGPVKVVTDWTPRELSTTPIGADELAKARSDRPQPRKEGPKAMEKWLRDFLESRGLPAAATEDEARAFLQTLDIKRPVETPPAAPAPATPPAVDAEAVRAEERSRVLAIRSMCDEFQVPDIADKMISDGTGIDQARASVMEVLKTRWASQPQGAGFSPTRMEPGKDARDKFRDAASESILVRTGLHEDVAKAAPGATELASYSLRELARESLRVAGQPTGGNVLELVGRALMTTDLPYVLAAGANKTLLQGWEEAETTYQIWCGIGDLPDFKTLNLVSLSEFDDLDTVPEGAKYNYGDVTDAKEAVALTTYGKIFPVTRQAIINDDLNALTNVPMAMGAAARRKVNTLPYAVLTTNGNMSDGKALFYARTYTNIGSSGVISQTTIAEAEKLMALQRDAKGNQVLNIRPVFLIAPVACRAAAETLFNTDKIANAASEVMTNRYSGAFTRVYEPLLDAADSTDWYMAARPGRTITVFFLQGQRTPRMEQQTGWTVDGVEYKVSIDAAAKALDWRGLFFNEGGS